MKINDSGICHPRAKHEITKKQLINRISIKKLINSNS